MTYADTPISRRRALALGGGLAGGLIAASAPALSGASAATMTGPTTAARSTGHLPVRRIEDILQAEGTVSDGVLSIEVERDDLHVTGPGGIPFKPSWEIKHEFMFQPLPGGQAFFNGDVCLLARELNPVIDQIVTHDLVFMAEHQHFFDLRPMVFFIHFRGVGDPIRLARAVAAVVSVTGTPLPQTMPAHPTTPLHPGALARILGGTAEVGAAGVVTVAIPRRDTIVLAGHPVEPELGVETTLAFEPLGGGQHAAVAPDFALVAAEVNPVVKLMREQGFAIHCLYNQETAEHPQLYFSHQLAVGDAMELARKVRRGLGRTNSVRGG